MALRMCILCCIPAVCVQAKANAVPSIGLKQLPASPLAKLMQAAGLNISHSSSNALPRPAPAAAAAAASQAAGCSSYPAPARAVSPIVQATCPGQPANKQQLPAPLLLQQQQQQQREDSRSNAEVAAAALALITQLRLALTGKVEGIMRGEFDEMWLDVVCAKPPWSDEDFLYVLHKHWRSVLQVGERYAGPFLLIIFGLVDSASPAHLTAQLQVLLCMSNCW
jgi:hypothetical protein